LMESPSCSSSLFAHDLFGKPVSTFPDHALETLFHFSWDDAVKSPPLACLIAQRPARMLHVRFV
jgi:hypothetical protein